MKKLMWQLAGFLPIFLAASTAICQTDRGITVANIPFPFTVANQTLPPGRYTVTPMGGTNLRISGLHNQGTFVQTHEVLGKVLEGRGKMVFHRYGNTYFLSEIWGAANNTGHKVFPSRAEVKLNKKQIEKEIAVLQIAQ